MTPEAHGHIEKAREYLAKARNLPDIVHYSDEAGRAVYLAGFHAAQALISERTGRVPKTHSGVNAQFNLLVKEDARVDGELRAFLPRAFDLKTTVDYATGPDAFVSPENVERAMRMAVRLVDVIVEILA